MSDPEDTIVVGPEVLKAQLSSAAIAAGMTGAPTESGAAIDHTEEWVRREFERLNRSEAGAVFPIDEPRPTKNALIDEVNADIQSGRLPTGRMTPSEAFLYDAFRSAARNLKTAEAEFKAAQRVYGEAVGKLSDVVTK